jgi:DNA-binding protein H-NS
MDLSGYDLQQLTDLRRRVEDEIRARHTVDPHESEHQLRDAAQKWGFALTEVLMGVAPASELRMRRIRYQHPFDPHVGWSGMGVKPDWILQWEANGGSLEELRVRH